MIKQATNNPAYYYPKVNCFSPKFMNYLQHHIYWLRATKNVPKDDTGKVNIIQTTAETGTKVRYVLGII